MKKFKKNSFTLIEILLTSSLILIVGLAVYSVLSSGLTLFKRLSKPYLEEDVSIFFTKISKELRNAFPYKGIRFLGDSHNLKIPTLITSSQHISCLTVEPGEIHYTFDPEKKEVERIEKDLSNLFREEQGLRRILLEDVEAFKFKYYLYDPQREDYFWVDSYTQEGFPLAVKLELTLNYEGKTYNFSKTITLPISG